MHLLQEIHMVSSSHAVETRSHIIGSYFDEVRFNYPLTIKISPQHYSSTVKIEFSYVLGSSHPYDHSQSIIIHEKLVLEQK